MVNGALLFSIESEDRLLQRLAFQMAGVMLSSGNYKKGTDVQDLTESIYAPLIPQENTENKRELIEDPEESKAFVKQLAERVNRQ